ncbi:hypothetical protein ABTX35_02950 [Streptomyces sp. NPDC096080]|uniref:DUF6907 domain-containing protein n=1 Tax=Streptomyces sp. NPDC096080 TaxID=3156693 RepID=UPI003324FA69
MPTVASNRAAATDEVQVPIVRSDALTVLIGAGFPDQVGPTEVWATPDMAPHHNYEAVYDPARTSRAEAEATVRALLATDDLTVTRFLSDGFLTRTFLNKETGAAETFTCTPGCTLSHPQPGDRAVFPEDVYCITDGTSADLPAMGPECESGKPEEFRLLSWHFYTAHFSPRLSERIPHARVELFEEHWVEGLDPDALALLIDTVQKQVDELRGAHAALTALRAAHAARTEAAAPSERCPIYRDCDETGPHYDHSSYGLLTVADETGHDSLIEAGMVALSGETTRATVCLGDAEFQSAAALRKKTAEMRAFLDQVDQLGDRVFTDQQGDALNGPTKEAA